MGSTSHLRKQYGKKLTRQVSCVVSFQISKMRNLVIFLGILLTVNVPADGKLTQITEDNRSDTLTGEWMVEFMAPWCPACRGLQPIWDDFSGWSEDLDIGVGQVDVTTSPGLSGRFMVTALPTIFHVKDGVFRQYRGARDKDSFISFVEDKKWTQVEEISSWKDPNSIQMSLVSYFFKLSMVLRNVHTTLTEDYQLPYWVSYVAFAIATILLGGILGLILVCCIDCIFPPRREDNQHKQTRDDKKDSDVEEDDDEDLEEIDRDSQEEDEAEDLSLNEDEEQSQEEQESQEDSPRISDNKARKRRTRKTD